jgi:hypothetical protein
MKRLAIIFFLLLMISNPDVANTEDSHIDSINRFSSCVVNTHGPLLDRLVEYETGAPSEEMDRMAERVQRLAAAYLKAEDRAESRRHWSALREEIRKIVREKGVVDRQLTEPHGSSGTERRRHCRIVDYGKPPGTIDVERGCFHRRCGEIRGKFSVDMGWGVSGGDGPMAQIDMTVTVDGNRAVIHRSGFQTLDWFEDVTVDRRGPVVVFSHDEKTTFAMGAREFARPVSDHRFYGADGEYFSLMLPPDEKSQAIVHFGILEPENVLQRVCSPITQDDAWFVDAARSVGGITPQSTKEDVVKIFGADHVEAYEIPVGEGMAVDGTRVYGGTKNELLIEWKQDGTPERLEISREGSDWETPGGITIGSSLEKVETVNGQPVLFTGFGWDYGGRTVSWEGGALSPELQLELESPKTLSDDEEEFVTGDKEILSDSPLVDSRDFTVKRIFIRWSNKE